MLRPTFLSLLTGGALLAVAPATAHAQLGGMLKRAVAGKAADKASDAADRVAPGSLPESAYGVPFTEATLTATLRGLGAEARAKTRRDSAEAVLQDADARLRQMGSAPEDGRVMQDYRDRHDHWQTCYNDAMRKAAREVAAHNRGQQQAAQQQMMADPAKRQQMMELSAQLSDAVRRGDTAEQRRIQEKLTAAMGMRMAADSSVGLRACGAEPAAPAVVLAERRQQAVVDSLRNGTRDVERELTGTGEAASGMPAARYAQARERLQFWAYNGNTQRVFGDPEVALFQRHADEIRQSMPGARSTRSR